MRGTRTERAVLAFVLLALATLVAVPVLVNRRVQDLREEIEGSEPTRTLVTRLEFNLVREMAALSEAMLTADTSAVADYGAALAREDSIYGALEAHVRNLGPDVQAQFELVRRQSSLWHARAADAEDLLADYGDTTQPRSRRERQLFEDLLLETRRLDAAILGRTNDIRDEIGQAERLGLNLSFALGLLALGAGGAAALLAGRSRRFAMESERRRADAERALDELAHETDLRHRLIQGITHDVKNPLGAAKGFAELLALGIKAPILPEQLPLVEGVQRSVDGALAIITDLLDVARAESGGLSVQPADVDLAGVVAACVEDSRPEAEAAGHTLIYEPPRRSIGIHTDPTRVRQILQNLLSNAVKYTPSPGRITVEARVYPPEGGAHEPGWVVVRVSDSGPGIPLAMRERIFDEFTRLEDKGAIQGHGLGLAIARRVARLLGGDLRVEDSDQPGATFALLLPLPEAAQSAAGH